MANISELRNQLYESERSVLFTYVSHWIIYNRIKNRDKVIRLFQIGLTALSTCGFFSSAVSGIYWLNWIGGLTSALALAATLYTLNFNSADLMKSHSDAANDLWEIKEGYRSLLVDFDSLQVEEIRERRDKLISSMSKVNKCYPGTDEKAFKKAQKDIKNYIYSPGEAK